MTPEAFDLALAELGWKGTDFCHRAGLVPNTVWRWRKALAPIPAWAGEYLRAMLAIQRLHAEFVAVLRPGGVVAGAAFTSIRQGLVEAAEHARGGQAGAAVYEPVPTIKGRPE